MEFYIPPHRARAIWQEYLDRQAVERRNRLEMAKKVMTWYSDLESEVAQHFQKALECSAAKRRRLADDASTDGHLSPLPSTRDSDTADCSTRSWPVDTPSRTSHPHRLPSLFPHLPGLPPLSMTYPEYYQYTSEVDPFIDDDLSPTDGAFDFPTHEAEFADSHHQMRDGLNILHTHDNQSGDMPASRHGEMTWPPATPPSHLCDPEPQPLHGSPLFTSAADSAAISENQSTDRRQQQLDVGHPQPSTLSPDDQFFTTGPQLPIGDVFSPSLSHHNPTSLASSHGDTDSPFDACNLSLDYAVCTSTASSDDVMDGEDDIIDNIQLDWTEEEKNELRTIAV